MLFFTKKYHWYRFTFKDAKGYKSTNMGYRKKDQLTEKLISVAAKYANTFDGSTCLINLSYLGYMGIKNFDINGVYDEYS